MPTSTTSGPRPPHACEERVPAQDPCGSGAGTLPSVQAALRRRAGDFRAVRFAAGLRRALPARFAAIFLFAGWRRGPAFFFAILAMVGSLFLFFPDGHSAQQRIDNT